MALTTGYNPSTASCSVDTTGGLALLKVAPFRDFSAVTRDASGKITAITFVATKDWLPMNGWEVNQTQLTETQVGQSKYYTQRITAVFKGRNDDIARFIEDCISENTCGLGVYCKEANGNKVIMGLNRIGDKGPGVAVCLDNEGTTGTGGDSNGISQETVNFQCIDIGKVPRTTIAL